MFGRCHKSTPGFIHSYLRRRRHKRASSPVSRQLFLFNWRYNVCLRKMARCQKASDHEWRWNRATRSDGPRANSSAELGRVLRILWRHSPKMWRSKASRSRLKHLMLPAIPLRSRCIFYEARAESSCPCDRPLRPDLLHCRGRARPENAGFLRPAKAAGFLRPWRPRQGRLVWTAE